MSGWLDALVRLAARVETEVDRARYAATGRRTDLPPPRVVPYRGYGTATELSIFGRVLRNAPVAPAGAEDGTLRNLVATYQRLETDEVPGATVRIWTGTTERIVTADDEGFFECRLPNDSPAPLGESWFAVNADVVPSSGAPAALVPVLVPPASASLGVISDIDDTVVRTDAGQLLRMARTVALGNARTRLPFDGVAEFYQALHRGASGAERNPLFYVSSGPWNFYDLLAEFFELQQIPLGPIILRDWGLSPNELLPLRHATHKRAAIDRILATYPSLPFVLIGDSGQEDPEIYAAVMRDFPGRIRAAYIRDVSRAATRAASIRTLASELARSGGVLLLVDDTAAAMRHAREQGWIAS